MTMDLARALVDLEINVRKLAQTLENKDPEAKRLINLILQDAYVVKNALDGYETSQIGYIDAYGSDRCNINLRGRA